MSKSTWSRISSRKSGKPVGLSEGRPASRAIDLLEGVLVVSALAAVAIGVYARFKGLGRWPVSYDECWTGTSVRNILRHGFPTLVDSGDYLRGLLVMYLQAGVSLLGFGEEFSLRAVSALSNVGMLPAVYLLSRKVSGRPAALLATAAVALSAWEIEFSRFGRMYAPFQCIFVWFSWCLHGYVVEGERKGWQGACLLAFLSIFVHEGALFLFVLLLFVPLIQRGTLPAKNLVPVLAGFLLALAFNFRNLGGIGGSASASATLVRPPVFGSLVLDSVALFVPALLLVAFNAVLAWKILGDRKTPWVARCAMTAGIVTSLLGLFGTVPLLFLAVLLTGSERVRPDWKDPWVKGAGLAVAVDFAFWAGILLLHPQAGNLLPGGGMERLATLFSYPEIRLRVFSPWFEVLPVFCLLGAGILVWWVLDLQRMPEDPAREGGRLVGLLVLGTVALLGAVRTVYLSTRYSFLLYPLLLVVLLDAMRRVADVVTRDEAGRRLALGILFALFLGFSEDVRADRLFRVDSAEVNFRLPYVFPEMNHYIPRFDYRTPAESVNDGRKPGDVVVSCVLPPTYYLRFPPDYCFIHRQDPEYRYLVDIPRGRDHWTGATVIDRESDLLALLDDPSRTYWVIAGSESFPFGRGVPGLLARRYRSAEIRRGVDGAILVYRLPAGRYTGPAAGGSSK